MGKKEQQSQEQQKEQEQPQPPVGTELQNSEFTKSPHTTDHEEIEE